MITKFILVELLFYPEGKVNLVNRKLNSAEKKSKKE